MSRSALIIAVLLASFVLLVRLWIYFQSQASYQDGQNLTFEAVLLTEPERKASLQRFSIKPKAGERIFITAPAFPRYHYGESLKISGTIKQQMLDSNQVVNTMFFPKISLQEKDLNFLLSFIFHSREKIKSVFQSTLPPVGSSLLMGIVFGTKEQLPKEFEKSLSSVGLMHIIAASGMNVSMIAAGAFMLLSQVLKRQNAIIASILVISLYIVIAGFSPSLIRAGIMGCLAFAAALLGKQYFALFALSLTAYVMLLFDPELLSDIGFQLSFMATLGIIVLVPFFSRKKKGKTQATELVPGDIATTIAAQIATLPILLTSFGQYGLLSIPVNALVLWTVPLLMTFGGLAAIFTLILPVISKILLLLALPFLIYLEYIVNYFGKLNLNLTLSEFPASFTIGYYLLLGAFILFYKNRKTQKAKTKTQSQA